ncbi:MAG: glutamine amidotransferase [Propionibacteriaceae bacterium]|jgi:GMP synthase (glutamine-hydrolysing)|nr:glutamine amidotransferase [Propionibacteriaceae bacterium]
MPPVKPFLLLSTRDDDATAIGEASAVRRVCALADDDLVQLRLEQTPLPADLSLDDYAGVILGGSGFCTSSATKSPLQQRVEADLGRLLDEIIERDFPFFGLCYGVGVLATHLGGVVDSTHKEDVGAIAIRLTEAGRADPLTAGLTEPFWGYVGHKEAVRTLPEGAVVLATGETCPVQLFRVKTNVYAAQFHPELDTDGLIERMGVYRNAGYFAPDDFDRLAADAHASGVDGTQEIPLQRFVERHR